MTVSLENRCKEDMSCSVSWRVTCSGPAGRHVSPHSESGWVPAGETRSWEVTTQECAPGDGYAISAPEWTCRSGPDERPKQYLAR